MEEIIKKKPALIFIFFTVLIDMMGVGLIIPIIPDLIASLTGQDINEGAFIAGLLFASYAGAQFLFAPVMGELSDRYGRKPVLLLALFGLGIDYFIHAFAPTIAWLFLGRIIAGVFGASHTVAMAYIADISTKEDKAKNFGIIGAAFGLGFVLGPGLGGVVADFWGVKAPFFLAAIFSLVNFLFGIFLVKESLPKELRREVNLKKMIPFVSLAHMGKYKAAIGFVIAFALAQLAGQVMPATWSFYTIERYGWSTTEVGVSLMIVGLLVSIVQAVLTGFLVKKYGNRKVILLGFTCWTLGMFAITFADNTFYLYAATIPYLVGGIAGPTVQGLVSNLVKDSEQGNFQGVLTSLSSLTAVFGPLIYTVLFASFTGEKAIVYFPGAPYLLGTAILIVATLVALYSLNKLILPSDENILDNQLESSKNEIK